MKYARCGFQWTLPRESIGHACLRKRDHKGDHVCYCGEDAKQKKER